jgi:PKD repeat protein
MNLKRIIFFLGFVCLSLFTEAQNLSQHNWYFGNSANAIRFNRGTNQPALVNNKFIPFGTGGSAVATNASNADLLFYTDGKNIYDATNVLMDAANAPTNGAGLLGNITANQPVVICPMPEDSTKYLVFANTANYTTGGTITVSVVDMTAFGNAISPAPPLGKVLKKNMGTGLVSRSEGMIIIPHSNGKDYWLITHQNSNTNFTASLVTKTSFNAGAGTFTFTLTSIANGVVTFPMSVANFSYNSKLKKLAISAQDSNTDAVILSFDDNTGAITFNPLPPLSDRYLFNTGTATVNPQSIYDIQWDEDGQYLYISRVGEPGINADVLQYDYLNPSNTLTSVVKSPEFRSWGLQLAPDSAIYHIYQAVSGGPFLIKKFTKTDTIASSVIETALPFGAIDFKGTQFPSFSSRARIILQLSFTPLTACQNTNTTFFPSIIPNADSLRWDLGDTTVTDWSPVHKYKNAQTYNVKLTAYFQGDSISVTQPVTVNAFDLRLTLPTDTTACHDEFPPPYGSSSPKQFSVKVKAAGTNAASATFTWSNGQTGNTLQPAKPGYFYVTTAPDVNGCVAYAGVNVKEYGLQDQRSNIWYFGNNAGIDFNGLNATPPTGVVPLSGSNMDAPAGCAIVCDRNGQAIFYTDGDQVYDKTKTSIASGIGGNPTSSQSALIVPVPGDETLYYIFTTQAIQIGSNNEVRYSLFDLKLNNGNGGIAPNQKAVLLFTKSTERITASTDWLIAHEWGNNTFRAYRITAGGLGDPVYSAIGSDHSFEIPQNGEGYMKLGPKNTLAVALSSPGISNLVELFHLNDSTGVLSYYRKLTLSNTAGQVYGIEFSPAGNKVFASVSGAASSDIYEYSIDSLGHTQLKRDSVFAVTIGELQLAPDNRIYIAINNSTKLGTIDPVDDIKLKSPIDMGTGFALAAGTNSRMGLPNFIQHVSNGFGGPGFTFTGICVGDTTKFVGSATDAIDKFQWFFGDGSGSTVGSPNHLYALAGTYTVSMRLTNRCGLDVTITKQVIINAPPARPTLSPATPLCSAPVTLHANTPSSGIFNYSWSTGATTEFIIVSQPILVSVINTDPITGCSSTATGVVVDNRPQVNLGPDQTVCQNTIVLALDAQNSGDNFGWKINGTNASITQFQSVDTTVPGIFTYSVTVTDPITTCVTSAQKTFTVIQSPTFTFTSTNSACGASTGSITVSSISTPHIYSYFLTGPSGFNQQGIDQPVTTTTIGPLGGKPAGTYSAIITDQVSGCTISSTVGVNNNTFTVTPSTSNQCDPPQINVNTTVAAFPLQYLVTNGSTGQTVSNNNINTANFSVQLPSQGQGTTIIYTVQVTDANGCIVVPNYNVTTKTTTPLAFQFNPCANPATLQEISGATGHVWTGTGIAVSFSGNPLIVSTIGTDTYQVTALSNGCSITQTTTVDFNGTITPNFTFNACQDQVILVATPANGNYSYRWYESGSVNAPAPDYIGQQIAIGIAPYNKTVALEIFDSQSGCTTTPRASKLVQVFGAITASLTSTLACNDGKLFTITAATNAPSPIYEWSYNNTKIPGALKDTIQKKSEGTYKVKIKQGTCLDSATIQIVKAPIPIGALKLMYQICNDPDNNDPSTKTVDLDPGSFFTYSWFIDGVAAPAPNTSEIYTASQIGKYRVDLTNIFGCANSNSTEVINNCEPIIAGPNAFRPSSTHTDNTYFQLFTFYIDSFEVIVFNRWGESVYESKDRDFKWNGGYKNNSGQPLPGDTYTYLVRYVSHYHPERGVQELRAGVVLLR